MSCCFLCDTSYNLSIGDYYNIVYEEGKQFAYFMKYMPIMIGSSGTVTNDQQHTNEKTQNYVSYRVKKIEFRCTVYEQYVTPNNIPFPEMIILFKVPFREPIFDYYFTLMKEFILYSEPESVLDYCVCPHAATNPVNPPNNHYFPTDFNITINKPFIVGPNDYVGVLYFFGRMKRIYSSAKVWFDVV